MIIAIWAMLMLNVGTYALNKLNRLQLEMKIQIEACYIDHHHDIGSKVYLKLCLHLAFWDMSQFRIRVLIKVSICVSGHELGFKSKVGNQLQWGVAHDHIKGRLRSAVHFDGYTTHFKLCRHLVL